MPNTTNDRYLKIFNDAGDMNNSGTPYIVSKCFTIFFFD